MHLVLHIPALSVRSPMSPGCTAAVVYLFSTLHLLGMFSPSLLSYPVKTIAWLMRLSPLLRRSSLVIPIGKKTSNVKTYPQDSRARGGGRHNRGGGNRKVFFLFRKKLFEKHNKSFRKLQLTCTSYRGNHLSGGYLLKD